MNYNHTNNSDFTYLIIIRALALLLYFLAIKREGYAFLTASHQSKWLRKKGSVFVVYSLSTDKVNTLGTAVQDELNE